MTLPQQTRAPRPARLSAALGLLAGVLLVGAVAVVRSAADAPGEVRTDGVPRDADQAGAVTFTPAELPHAGLVPQRTDAMRSVIEAVAVGPAERRDLPPRGAFETMSACAVRNRLLPRDLVPITYKATASTCLVANGVLDDPYLGRPAPYLDARRHGVAIDHIVSPAYAWHHGAAAWTPAQRAAFARDARNQVVVGARAVRAKAGRGPADWLPPNVAIRCAYAARFAEVAAEYGLTVTAGDQEIARRQCTAR